MQIICILFNFIVHSFIPTWLPYRGTFPLHGRDRISVRANKNPLPPTYNYFTLDISCQSYYRKFVCTVGRLTFWLAFILKLKLNYGHCAYDWYVLRTMNDFYSTRILVLKVISKEMFIVLEGYADLALSVRVVLIKALILAFIFAVMLSQVEKNCLSAIYFQLTCFTYYFSSWSVCYLYCCYY